MPAPVTVAYGGTTGATAAAGLGSQLSAAILTVYSKQILFDFQPFTFFDQFTVKKTELGLLPGHTIQFMKYNNLTAGGVLTEDTAMSVQALSASTISLTVAEYGNAVSVSEFLLHSSFDDVMSSAAKLLGMDYAKVVDKALRDQIESQVTNIKFGGAQAATTTLTAAHDFTTTEVKDSVESLKTLNVPGIPEAGGSYVCILHPHQARTLRDDSAWINASNYAGATQIFNGEIGKFEDVRFVETTQAAKIPANTNSNTVISGIAGAVENTTIDVYHAYVLGYNLLAHAVALPVEMRDGGVIDFGRQHNLAYYSIEGFKCIQTESGVIIKTA